MSGSSATLGDDLFSGRKLGKYEVVSRLSTGGMSEIFLAFQKGVAGFRKLVVLKQILPDIKGEEEFVRMFLEEAKITAAFSHPNIAQVYDLDIQEGELFLAMEFIPGVTLVDVAKACYAEREPIPIGFSLSVVRDTALALHYAHTFRDPAGRPQQIVHRDIAEKNVMVTYEGVTKLLDFGIAKRLNSKGRTNVGIVKGTSGYMSPEQVLGKKLDPRSDVFSLGVVLHELFTGTRLFFGKDAEAELMAPVNERVQPPSRQNPAVSPELDAVVMRALERQPEDRYASAKDLARDIERVGTALLWDSEQCGAFIRKHFRERREQTATLLETAHSESSDLTGFTKVAALLGTHRAPEPVQTAVPLEAPPRALTREGLRVTAVAAASPQELTARERPDAAGGNGRDERGTLPAVVELLTTDSGTLPPNVPELDLDRTVAGEAVPWQPEVNGGEGPTVQGGGAPPPHVAKPSVVTTNERLANLRRATPPPGAEEPVTESRPPPPDGLRARLLRGQLLAFLGGLAMVLALASVVFTIWLRPASRDEKPAMAADEPLPTVDAKPAKGPRKTGQKATTAELKAAEAVETKTAETKTAAAHTPPAEAAEARSEETKPVLAAVTAAPAEEEAPKKSRVRREPKRRVATKEKRPEVAQGQLTLVSEPYAEVFLGEQSLGTTPLFSLPLPAGRHVLRLVGPDQKSRKLPVEVSAGEVRRVRVALSALAAD